MDFHMSGKDKTCTTKMQSLLVDRINKWNWLNYEASYFQPKLYLENFGTIIKFSFKYKE